MVGFKRKNSSERDKLITNGVDNGYGALDTDKAKNPLEFEKSRAKVKPEKPSAALYALFRYATVSDLCLILLGSVCAVINGVGFPLMSLVLGGMSDAFIAAQNSDFAKNNRGRNTSSLFVFNNSIPQYVLPTLSANEFESQVAQFALYYVYIGFIIMVTSYLQVACWTSACERQMNQLRRRFFHGILRQNIGWFDEQKTGEFTTKLADDLERVKEGIGDKLGLMIQYAATFIAGFVIAFAESWKMTLVMMSLTPFIAISSGFIGKFIAQSSRKEQQSYAVAGGIADEVISCIRTVLVFNGQHKEAERYENALKEGQKLGIRKQLLAGLALFFLFVILFGTYALAFWYGSVMITEGDITPGTVFIVFFSVMSGSFSIGNVAPQIPIVATAKAAAAGLFEVIDRIPSIDSYSKSGKEPSKVVSRVEFKNVHFTYPTRQNVKILNGISFDVEPGKTVAIVGPSGCGKSTILQLLLRFYDIEGGQILVSGEEVQNLNLKWLRSTIAAVTQEPNLFDASVTENIRLGRKDASLEEIEKVCKMANAHNFIVGLPNGYETIVGERGTQLSGGQKQRIAIARALIRNPQILLLDEATSALDAESEGIVQQALDKAKEGRTTIVIAHRLSTIRNADKIVAMDAGEVVEVGTHAELMANRRLYYDLVSNQTFETLQPPPIEEITNEADFAAQPHFQDGTTVLDDIAELNMKRRHLSQQMSTVSIRSGHSEKSNASRKPLTRAISMGKPKDDKERLIEELKEENVKKTNLAEISKVAKTEWGYMAIGFIGAAVRGAVMPAFSFFFSEIFNVYSKTGQELLDGATFWALMFLVLGFANGTACLAASYYFGLTGEKLTMRLRSQVFRNILRQDAAYFDDGKRSTGKLCTRLATDAPNVKGAIDFRLTTLVASVISLIAGIVIAFIYGWKLALLILGIVPLLALASWINIKLRRLSDEGGAKLLENAGKVVSETISNIRTVQSLTREHTFYDNFCRHLEIPYRQALRQCQTHAIGYAFATSFIFFLYAASFRLGAFLAAIGDIQPLDVFKVFFAIAFCGMTAGWAAAYIPEYAKARMSGALIFKMLREIPHIDGTSQLGVKANISGAVTFKRVTFAYPTRPEIKVLNGLTFHVNPGQTVALVGQSGCGKSTVVSLLERLYDVKEGQILFDNFDIKTLNLPDLRNHISLVSQEPLLFDCSIWENIAYGLEPPVGHERIVAAAKAANIHDFIMTLPQGYNTEVGEKGTQLSGGQKQRVAIARAIIRDPKILLLDEATSALDTESEKIVQEALDEARKGRTCIIVAHRLSTIQSADNIIVMKGGKVIETGTHQELLAQKNVYFNLIQNQQVQE